MSMYLRFKRGKQTLFLHCNPSELVEDLKARVAEIVDKSVADIRLVDTAQDKPLDDGKTVAAHDLESGTIVPFVFRVGEDEWEEVAYENQAAAGAVSGVEVAAAASASAAD